MQNAFVLHVRPYTDSRLLIDFFTEHDGLIRAVGRTPGKRDRAKYQPFQPLELEFSGSGELKTLRSCELTNHIAFSLLGHSLFCGLYINELLLRVLQADEPFPPLFSFYGGAVQALKANPSHQQTESVLRSLELFLLEQLGFGVDFDSSETGQPINEERFYFYRAGHGFCECGQDSGEAIPGHHLSAIDRRDFSDEAILRSAKIITRAALSPLIGEKPLKSRDLFR
jgi:DNA repair protein RecO (recombination protein O)